MAQHQPGYQNYFHPKLESFLAVSIKPRVWSNAYNELFFLFFMMVGDKGPQKSFSKMGFFTFSLSVWSLDIIKDADSVYGFILQKMFIKT